MENKEGELDLTENQKNLIKEIMEKHPKIDYMFALMLVTTPLEKLDELMKDYKQPEETNEIKTGYIEILEGEE